MEDRELTKLAAKAAGIELIEWPNGRLIQNDNTTEFARTVNNTYNGGFPERFDPLEYDHQAFRLAVNLDISVRQKFAMVQAEYPLVEGINTRKVLCEGVLDDCYAATRRAIVRAAAEIGSKIDAPLVRAD